MAINTLEYAKLFMQTLDKQMVAEAATGWMEANAGDVIYNGGDEVKVPKISMNGLGDYDRDNGFVQGSVTLGYETLKMTQDRGRTFQLDAMDVNETNFVASAGAVMGEFQRVMVAPEVDAYRCSSIASQAITKNQQSSYEASADDIVSKLLYDIAAVRDVVGSNTELVIMMSGLVQPILSMGKEVSKYVDSSSFNQGGINLTVKTFDTVPIIPVPSARMKTAYTFYDGTTSGQEAGGFIPASEALDINWIVLPKKAPKAISKTDVIRIFDPMTNQKANAWKLDYRKYHDLWILEHSFDAIRVSITPKVN